MRQGITCILLFIQVVSKAKFQNTESIIFISSSICWGKYQIISLAVYLVSLMIVDAGFQSPSPTFD